MNSPIANLFLSLRNTLSALTDTGGNPYFSHVDQDLGQAARNTNGRPPVSFPAILIDVADVRYTSLSARAQSGTVTVVLRLLFPPLSASAAATPAVYAGKALYFYELEQLVYTTLQDTCPTLLDSSGKDILINIFGSFNRTSAHTQDRRDDLRVRELTFTIALDDYSATPGHAQHPATFTLSEEIDLP
jgi:hypothetical protein